MSSAPWYSSAIDFDALRITFIEQFDNEFSVQLHVHLSQEEFLFLDSCLVNRTVVDI